MQELKQTLKQAIKDLFNEDIEPQLTRPEEQFGDYSSNVAMQLGAKLGKQPREIAKALAGKLQATEMIAKTEVAGPGFINFWLSDKVLARAAVSATSLPEPLKDQQILIEFGDPNPFKEMHIGHLYSAVVGNSIANLLVAYGAVVHCVSYHGDVGLHVAKSIWAINKKINGDLSRLKELDNVKAYVKEGVFTVERSQSLIGSLYAEGAKAYETDEQAADEIRKINEHIYKKDDETVNKIYEWGLKHSLEEFGYFFKRVLHIPYERLYLESDASETGIKYVKQFTGKVFEESDGAIVYRGERVGLHTRVFITGQGLPTYEAKELGLAELKKHDYPTISRSLIITAHEQSDYFKVVLAALKEIDPEAAAIATHIPHGFVSLTSGKMSSRTGEIYSANSLLRDVKTEAEKIFPDVDHFTVLAAIKYGFLKHRLGSDIVYDPEESVSLDGNSGPYLQYAHARARSILTKASFEWPVDIDSLGIERVKPSKARINELPFEKDERSLARKISEFPEVIEKGAAELIPNYVANYLFELAQNFNRFYERNRIVNDPRQNLRVILVAAYADVLSRGLGLLGILAPEKM